MTPSTSKPFQHRRNLKLLLQQVFNHQPTSRIEIAHQTGLNKSTVSSLYNELDDQQLFEEVGQGESTSSGGRRPKLIQINKKYGLIASFDFGYDHLHMMVNYLDGEINYFKQERIHSNQLADILPIVEQQLDRVVASNNTINGLIGIGFSVHGVVLHDQILDSPFVDFDNINLQKHFEDKYHVPVVVENEANLSAIYERDFDDRYPNHNLVAVSIHRGVGAGVIINNQLYRGSHGLAGEIGRNVYLDPKTKQARKIEDFCSEYALLHELSQLEGHEVERDDLQRLIDRHDPAVDRKVRAFSSLLARAIFGATVSYDPEVLYINSILMDEVPELYVQLKAELVKLGQDRPIAIIRHSRDAQLLGSFSLVVNRCFQMHDLQLRFRY
ncbi:ROK family protein [Limosilactobacillus difficilis]|uniref:ROK family protein n=1 Tax=Limosilactobacillus difficilis TaxID=2991838 RepID=UPI0024B8E7BE|nr:ROK family protein [Limosilactobacillus difficilis]